MARWLFAMAQTRGLHVCVPSQIRPSRRPIAARYGLLAARYLRLDREVRAAHLYRRKYAGGKPAQKPRNPA